MNIAKSKPQRLWLTEKAIQKTLGKKNNGCT